VTILAWQRGGVVAGPAVVLVHDWASDGVSQWQDTGWVAGLERAGMAVYVPDLPGHGESADVLVPPDAEPAAWTAGAILLDLDRLSVGAFSAGGHAAGCLVAGHLAVRAPQRVHRLVLVSCDDRAVLPWAQEVAAALRDPTARVWHPEAAGAVARARADKRHHLPTLALWAQHATWPAATRLGALRTRVLLAVGQSDDRHERAPRLAALFHDGRMITVPGSGLEALQAPELVTAVGAFLREPPP